MNRFLITILLLFSTFTAWSQRVQGTGESNTHLYGDGFGARVREMPYTPGETEGSYYLFDHWSPGTIVLPGEQTVRDIFLKYSFLKRLIEIKTDTGYFSMNISDADHFTIYDDEQRAFKTFVAAQNYQYDGTPLTGALEVLHDGKIGLVAQVATKLIEANYKGALSGGSTNDKIVRDKAYFLVENYQLTALPTKKKKALEILQKYDADIKKYLKEEKLNPKREEDLIKIAEYLSSHQQKSSSSE